MKIRPLDNGSWRVHFDTNEYRHLLNGAPKRPARISQRVMAHSLRVGTAAEICLNQFNKKQTPHGPIWTLYVEAKDTTDRDSALLPREVWICEPLIREIEEFKGVENLDEYDEPTPLFNASKRTLQNWVKQSAENAATATGDDDFLKVSAHDFRRYFATHMLYRHNVDPEIVRQLGGWRSPRSMMEYLLLPDDILADELGDLGLLGADADLRLATGVPYRERNALQTLAKEIAESDAEDQKHLADKIADLFDGVSDIEVAVSTSTTAAERAADAMSDTSQSSLPQLDDFGADESGRISPMAPLKSAYIACLILFAWSVTIGPLV